MSIEPVSLRWPKNQSIDFPGERATATLGYSPELRNKKPEWVTSALLQRLRADKRLLRACLFLAAWLMLAGLLCLFVPAYTIGGWNHDVSVFHLGDQGNDPNVYLDWLALLKRQGVLIGTFAAIYCASYVASVRRRMWLVPGALYLVAAIWRLVFVPCVMTRSAFARFPETSYAFNLWIWQFNGQAVINGETITGGHPLVTLRYGLIVYEEFVLLFCVAAFYGLLYATSENARRTIRRALGFAQ